MMWPNKYKVDYEQKPEVPKMVIQKETHSVWNPKCDVCGQTVSVCVQFKHIAAKNHDQYGYHYNVVQPTNICKPCLAAALELPVEPTKTCSYCGK